MKVLVFAPHPDDEILGCGGVMARYVKTSNEVYVCIVTSGKPPIFDNSIAIKNGWPHNLYPEIMKAHKLIGVKDTFFLQEPAADLESSKRFSINAKIIELINRIKPEIVYIPHFGDMQKDHTIVSESVMVAVRPKSNHIVSKVYSYETLSETEWNIPHNAYSFIPNTFVDISDCLKIKLEAMNCYQSQLSDFPNPRSLETVEALAKFRGSTMCSKAAEAFSLIREYQK